jgi:hypothetical protein
MGSYNGKHLAEMHKLLDNSQSSPEKLLQKHLLENAGKSPTNDLKDLP